MNSSFNNRWQFAAVLMAGMSFSLSMGAKEACDAQEVSFRDQIQPLLANRCFACHGPDEQAREAGLRLDTEEGAKEWAIVAGDPDNSEIIVRIKSNDPDTQMPPPGHGEPLNAEQQQLLVRWIQQGATWQRHWAFQPIRQPDVPTDDTGWSQNPIDGFIWQKMTAAGLKPDPAAGKRKLIRRVYLDLIGIPPTLEQVDAFVSGKVSYADVVDQLLDSPRYGEQMAVSWLDLARYADTNGFQNDFRRSMWIWRDWVIDAYNRNMPMDEFIVEQIAGDLLPEATQSQLVATGFNRNSPTVTEGGTIEEEWRIENAMDRTETTAAGLLGLTMGCARCHDHKYDPISQREFYEFFAFFNNIDERGVYNEARGNTQPLIRVPTPEQTEQLEALAEKIAKVKQQLEAAQAIPVDQVLTNWRNVAKTVGSKLPEPIWEPANAKHTSDDGNGKTEWSPAGPAIANSLDRGTPRRQSKGQILLFDAIRLTPGRPGSTAMREERSGAK